MEKPIAPKVHRYPKDFISNISKLTQRSNLYTFNQASSRVESAINQKQLFNNIEANPEQNQQLRLNKNSHIQTKKIYFDVQSANNQQSEKIQNSMMQSKLETKIQRNNNQRYYRIQNQQEQKEQIQSQPNPDQKFKSSLSGVIVKQKVLNTPLSVQKQQQITRGSQKQFNRLALSLIGIKRSKFNRSCLEKHNKPDKPSFIMNQISSPKKINQSKQKQLFFNRYQKQQTQNQIYQHTYYPFRAKKIQSIKNQINRISYNSRLRRNFVQEINIPQPTNQLDNKDFQFQYNPNRGEMVPEIYYKAKPEIKINIKTSLSSLKNLLSFDLNTKRLNIQLPLFFLKPPTQLTKFQQFDPQILNNQCVHIFTSLDIPINTISIRKYSNCIVIINHNICIVWHDGKNGKKYIGSWRNKYFDEGQKEGLGLQWSPGRYIYYGEFKENKRNGFGLMRKSDHNVILGYWRNGKHQQYGIQKNYAY